MKINRNYLGAETTDIIIPYAFRDSVADLSALSAITSPLDGEIRYVISESKNYQYDKSVGTWDIINLSESSVENAVTSEQDGDWKKVLKIYYNPTTGNIKILYEE